MPRPITLEQAKAIYVHRYTLEHVPQWALKPEGANGEGPKYYAPQFVSDREWYESTMFPGEGFVGVREKHCHSTGQTWPLGQWLDAPYRR